MRIFKKKLFMRQKKKIGQESRQIAREESWSWTIIVR